jgi:hypothetical protein
MDHVMTDTHHGYMLPNRFRRLRAHRRWSWLADQRPVGGAPRVRRGSAIKALQRPDPSVVSAAIPLVYVGRNRDGFWVALDADTRIGGLFLFKSGALRFGRRRRHRELSATMEMTRLELPGANRGNPLIGYLAGAARAATPLREHLAAGVPRDALVRFARIAGTVAAFSLVLAVMMAMDVAIWVPHMHP